MDTMVTRPLSKSSAARRGGGLSRMAERVAHAVCSRGYGYCPLQNVIRVTTARQIQSGQKRGRGRDRESEGKIMFVVSAGQRWKRKKEKEKNKARLRMW